jgi:hypothetical protein
MTTNAGAPAAMHRDDDAVRPVTIVTGVWVVALLVLLLGADALGVADPAAWRWTAAVGVLFGILGIIATRRRRAAVLRQGVDRGSPSG